MRRDGRMDGWRARARVPVGCECHCRRHRSCMRRGGRMDGWRARACMPVGLHCGIWERKAHRHRTGQVHPRPGVYLRLSPSGSGAVSVRVLACVRVHVLVWVYVWRARVRVCARSRVRVCACARVRVCERSFAGKRSRQGRLRHHFPGNCRHPVTTRKWNHCAVYAPVVLPSRQPRQPRICELCGLAHRLVWRAHLDGTSTRKVSVQRFPPRVSSATGGVMGSSLLGEVRLGEGESKAAWHRWGRGGGAAGDQSLRL